MNIGLLGGTFNPPHIGHLLVAQQVLDFTLCDEVWMVPTYKHTFQKPAAPVEHRVEMTRILVDSVISSKNKQIKVCTIEIDQKLDGNTIHLLPFLPKEHIYTFIIGSDQLPSFHLWGEWKQLLNELPFLVFPRYGYPNEPLYAGMKVVNDQSLIVSNISSTKIRDRIKRGLLTHTFIPEPLEQYIVRNKLYL
jgi:nicotinate-nucleotide adenylyltransferase